MRAGIVAFLCFVVAAISLAPPAFGATNDAKPKGAAVKTNPQVLSISPPAPVGVFSDEAIAKFGNITQAQRDAMVKQAAEKLKKMTPKERQAFFAANRKSYEAMTPEKKKELAEKMKKASAEYIAAHKAEWDKKLAEDKKMEDKRIKEFLAKMPDIERAVFHKYKELRKKHSKDYAWHLIIQDAGKGGKITPIPEGQ